MARRDRRRERITEMAVLTAPELTTARLYCTTVFSVLAYTKPQINAALQAIEDAMTTQVIPP